MSRFAAALGAALWVAAPFVPIGAPPTLGSIEHVFVFLPLVAAPLALRLLSSLLHPIELADAWGWRTVRYIQPMAAVMLLASFFVAKGTLAGCLAAPWFVWAVLLALGDGRRILQARLSGPLSRLSLVSAHVFLPIGGAWLLLFRLDIVPRDFTPLRVFLAALHFHFSGFALQILIAATGLCLPGTWRRLTELHRVSAIGAVVSLLLIAAGNIAQAPVLKFMGVSAMILSTIALASSMAAVALNASSRPARWLLLVSAGSLLSAMLLAGVYGVGELTGHTFITIRRMVVSHGILNALGFTVCGLLGHLQLRNDTARMERTW
ncbi:MAG TPA: YndJ family transporter [Polyangiaceae bacterium]|nr:YndJ family transporter [Polyangiaceae bacterium]